MQQLTDIFLLDLTRK